MDDKVENEMNCDQIADLQMCVAMVKIFLIHQKFRIIPYVGMVVYGLPIFHSSLTDVGCVRRMNAYMYVYY